MPLRHGRTVKGIKAATHANIRREVHRGYDQKQAIAIGLSIAREDARKARIRPSLVNAGKLPKKRK